MVGSSVPALLLLTTINVLSIVSRSPVLANDVASSTAAATEGRAKERSADQSSYEAKMQQALEYYSSQKEEVIKKSIMKGSSVEINLGGIDFSGDGVEHDERESLYVNFAKEAVRSELELLERNKSQSQISAGKDEDDDEDEDEEDEEEKEEEEEEEEDEAAAAEKERIKRLKDIAQERKHRKKLDRKNWFKFKYWEIRAYFLCESLFQTTRPIYDAAKWRDLRDFYHKFKVRDEKDRPIPKGRPERTYQFADESTHDMPMEPFQTDKKGRGLRASRDIAEGELVFKATNNTVVFRHGHTWRKFLWAIYNRDPKRPDRSTACDIHAWSWVQPIPDEYGPIGIFLDLDSSSLLNEGRYEDGWEPPNIQCGLDDDDDDDDDDECRDEYYAMKDIKKGEELLVDYRDFALLHSWRHMGL